MHAYFIKEVIFSYSVTFLLLAKSDNWENAKADNWESGNEGNLICYKLIKKYQTIRNLDLGPYVSETSMVTLMRKNKIDSNIIDEIIQFMPLKYIMTLVECTPEKKYSLHLGHFMTSG